MSAAQSSLITPSTSRMAYDDHQRVNRQPSHPPFVRHWHTETETEMDDAEESLADGRLSGDEPGEEAVVQRPEERWIRWINIGGLDWGVLSTVALRYHLHLLALEEVLHEQGHYQSKADYYHRHLFCVTD
ncbi:hypothetical protein AX15_001359 [Amanita polypyramis BW_CC]|nr:hypothetical protein AX15_001359 [Amanita polypyramis BW_CC]